VNHTAHEQQPEPNGTGLPIVLVVFAAVFFAAGAAAALITLFTQA